MRILKNYFKVAWRNLVRNKIYSAINVFGLATGISACILIFLYVQDELTYERHFENSDRIFRVVSDAVIQGQHEKIALSPYKLANILKQNFPEAEKVTQIIAITKQTFWINEQAFNQEGLVYADSNFFQVFNYQFLAGNPHTALHQPKTIVITEELAKKYFGSVEKAMGQRMRFSKNTHQVVGVVHNPQHSHLQVTGFISSITLGKAVPDLYALNSATNWLMMNWYTYVRLADNSEAAVLKQKLDKLSKSTINPWLKEMNLTTTLTFDLQPLPDIHLNNEWKENLSPTGNKLYIYIFSFVATFILLIACINYMNLATARSAKRAREVGLRKVVGAHRGQLVRQFIGESVLITFVALILALSLVEMMLPHFNELTGKSPSYSYFSESYFLPALAALLLLVGLIGGSYPALFLSRFNPVEVLKSDKSLMGGHAWLRKFLVVLQFTISLIMIIGTVVVYSQMQFIKNAHLGFNKEQVLVIDIPVGDTTLLKRLPQIERELLQNPAIEQISITSHIPGERTNNVLTLLEQDSKKVEKAINIIGVDHQYFKLLDIPILKGRNFSKDFPADKKGSVLVNEALVKHMGWKEPLGKKINFSDWDAQVVGVVQDFHYTSLHSPIEPIIIGLQKESNGYLLARMPTDNLPATTAFIQEKWQQFDPKHPMESFFLDEFFDQQYRSEEKMLTIFGYFAGLTIIIACLGLLGLTSFTAEQRTREIGIRKVMGSSVADIIFLLSKDFALLVIIAIIIAGPLAWYGMNKWLQDFAYRTPLNWWIFALAGLFAIIISMLTVSIQAARAANKNPVQSLRSE